MSTAEPAPRLVETTDLPRELAALEASLQAVIEAIGGELELGPLLGRIVTAACALLAADHGTIGLVDPTRGIVRTEAGYQMPPDELGAELAPGVGLGGEVLRTGQAVVRARYGDLAQPTQAVFLEHAAFGLPIVWGDELIGVIGLGAAPPRRFDEHDVRQLAFFARHAAVAIVHARRYAAERRRAERLALIARIGSLITAAPRLSDLLQTAAAAIHDLLGYPNVAIPLIAPADPSMLVLRAFGGHYRSIMRGEYRIPISQGLMGAAARTRQVVLVNDVTADSRYLPTPGVTAVQAELAVPIILGEQVLGVLNVESDQPFGEDDATSLQIVADQLAAAIANARLLAAARRRAARMLTITRIGRLITSRLGRDELLATTVAALGELYPAAHLAVLLVDPDQPDRLVLRAHSDASAQAAVGTFQQAIGQGIIGAAARERRSIQVDDVRADPRWLEVAGLSVGGAELALPLLVGEELLGVLNVEQTAPIDPEDAEGLTIIADQVSVAIHNARLFDASQALLADAQLLAETSQRIGMGLDEDGVIAAYLEQVAARGRYTCTVVLYELDAAGRRQSVLIWGRWSVTEGLVHEEVRRQPRPPDALDPLLDAGQTVTISDARTDPRVSAELRQVQAAVGRPALAFIPLMARGQRGGLIILSAPRVQSWPATELRPYQVTATVLAATIDSRRQQRLVAERGRELAALEERQRLARELHDSVTQLVFGTTLIAQTVAPAWQRDPAEGERLIGRLLDLSQQALAELRALMAQRRSTGGAGAAALPGGAPPDERTGRPPPTASAAVGSGAAVSASPSLRVVREHGLVPALEAALDGVVADGLTITLAARRYRRQPVAVEVELYWIAREALANIVKHAQAGRVRMTLAAARHQVTLTVQDDGRGFTPASASASSGPPPGAAGGFGLGGMRERAATMGGTLTIISAPGQGTTVRVRVPTAGQGES